MYQGMATLAFATIIAMVVAIVLFFALIERDTASIGGTLVPSSLDCEEDEIIGFTGPDTLDCVHIENVQ